MRQWSCYVLDNRRIFSSGVIYDLKNATKRISPNNAPPRSSSIEFRPSQRFGRNTMPAAVEFEITSVTSLVISKPSYPAPVL